MDGAAVRRRPRGASRARRAPPPPPLPPLPHRRRRGAGRHVGSDRRPHQSADAACALPPAAARGGHPRRPRGDLCGRPHHPPRPLHRRGGPRGDALPRRRCRGGRHPPPPTPDGVAALPAAAATPTAAAVTIGASLLGGAAAGTAALKAVTAGVAVLGAAVGGLAGVGAAAAGAAAALGRAGVGPREALWACAGAGGVAGAVAALVLQERMLVTLTAFGGAGAAVGAAAALAGGIPPGGLGALEAAAVTGWGWAWLAAAGTLGAVGMVVQGRLLEGKGGWAGVGGSAPRRPRRVAAAARPWPWPCRRTRRWCRWRCHPSRRRR
ncbi:hypothetical protein BU14_0259s0018 [Porphyra umbilicalis]|uniref:DUF4203 domain-containing protein n=1 Tax=Porphyra umbilicalis TaxID=2786 RepID=A0A1X6P2W0_PORUM|nr:hypothetical protein BU14_0259s0018 [Porphyra umbilicalis]|eukprot:OSX74983.1 hypothetical protein BU14_0259s0018 [Porphyra umbilicalis]